nr:transposase, MuDR, MULE transposase domain protein [Tanacetum cinerariifolium]
MLHEMVMKKFNLEAIYPLNLSAKVSSIDDNFDITDDPEINKGFILENMQGLHNRRIFKEHEPSQDNQTDAYDKLCQVGPQRWSRAHFPLVRYNYLTSNSVESVNACTVVYRKLQVLKLAETYRAMVQEWYYQRRKLTGTCQCRKWQLSGIPLVTLYLLQGKDCA